MKLSNVIRKGEGKQTLLFVLIGYLFVWLWAIFLFMDLQYVRGNGASWIINRESIFFATILTLLVGIGLPLFCFWFKFYRWKLAWILMFLIFAGGVLYVALWENQPERIFRNRFGRLAEDVRLEAMVVSPSYESSYEAYKLSGDTGKIQSTLKRLFKGEERELSTNFQYLPKFMRPTKLQEKPEGWNYSIYVWTWTDGQYLYIRFNTWEYHALKEWEEMLCSTKPEAKP